MEIIPTIRKSFDEARASDALKVFAAYYLGFFVSVAILAVAVAPFFVYVPFLSNLPQAAQLAVAIVAGLLFLAYLLLVKVAIDVSLIAKAGSKQTMSHAWQLSKKRFPQFVLLSVSLIILLTAVNLLFLAVSLVFPLSGYAETLWGIINSGIGFLLSVAVTYAIYFCVLKGKGVVSSINLGFSLAKEKPVKVLITVVSAQVAKIIVLLLALLVVLLLTSLALLSYQQLAASMFAVVLAALFGLAAFASLVAGLAFSEVLEIIALKAFFTFLEGKKK
ncbi:hypothetical protein HZC09_00515 [Candidatus Micrarchaeota archaeon]|nr:hypothetical protein [Candidatus Micrarchaeota archaeon]